AFYAYLFATIRNPVVRGGAVVATLLTGLSRPYLGVHFLEDIIFGWALGLCVALMALTYEGSLERWWRQMSPAQQVVICVVASVVLWTMTIALNGGRIDDQPRAFLAYAGLVTGILVARPLELRGVAFDPATSSWRVKLARYVLGVMLILTTLIGLKLAFATVERMSWFGFVLQYVRYVAAGIVTIY